MKKLLSILTAISLITTTSTAVVACSQQNTERPAFPIWIGKPFYDRTVEGDKGNTPETVLEQLFEVNARFLKNTKITKNDVTLWNFYYANWEKDGEVRLAATNDSKIIGDIPIRIYKLSKINIELETDKLSMDADTEERVKITNFSDLVSPKIEFRDNAGKDIFEIRIDEEKGEIVINAKKPIDSHFSAYIDVSAENAYYTSLWVWIK